MIPHVLSIAGSDPSAGAGVQADLKTFSALGVYGMTVITALTAQNTRRVAAVHEVPHHFVMAQLEAISQDIRIDAIKIGMAGGPQTIDILIEFIQRFKPRNVVVDPVMVAQSGDRLASDEGIRALRLLLPAANIITPNIPEAETLLNSKFDGDMEDFTRRMMKELKVEAVFLKGGHGEGETSNDFYRDKHTTRLMEEERIKTKNNHGTGCTLSSAIAAYLAKGLPMVEACAAAKLYVAKALRESDQLQIGSGAGPVHHFFAQWD